MAQDFAQTIKDGYTFSSAMLDVGRPIRDGQMFPDVPVGLPMAMMNRHGLIAGATGTGKTVTLQILAEGLSAAGVPVFLSGPLGWGFTEVGSFLALWVIGYGAVQSAAPSLLGRFTGGTTPRGGVAAGANICVSTPAPRISTL